jgi:NTP pyrophosphatase (non-canonical NTP hydrolase)
MKGTPVPNDHPSLNDLAAEINLINTGNGWSVLRPSEWGQPYKVPAVIALIQSEASEALEAFRNDDEANFAEELADVIIRTLDCAGGLGIDVDKAVREKLQRNRQRGYRHGGKRV